MSEKKTLKKAGLITGAFLTVAIAGIASTGNTADLLTYKALGSGSEIRVEIADMNSAIPISTLELKCGEGKCGEGKCGEGDKKEKGKVSKKESKAKNKAKSKKKAKKSKESKAKESKCGEGKCGN